MRPPCSSSDAVFTLRTIDDRVERHASVTRTAVAEQPNGRNQAFGVRIDYRTEADRMLPAAFIGRRRRGWVTSDEVGDVRI